MNQYRKFTAGIILLFLPVLLSAAGEKNKPLKSSGNNLQGKRRLLKVTFVDVGQGDCQFIQTPGGKTILIDAGMGASQWSSYDAGEKIVIPFLESLKIEKIDYVIISHAHSDHIGGLRAVLNRFKVGNFVDPGLQYPSWVYESGGRIQLGQILRIQGSQPPCQIFQGRERGKR